MSFKIGDTVRVNPDKNVLNGKEYPLGGLSGHDMEVVVASGWTGTIIGRNPAKRSPFIWRVEFKACEQYLNAVKSVTLLKYWKDRSSRTNFKPEELTN